VKHIVSAHGGTIDVRSSEREGTTFTVRLRKQFAEGPG
jgi:signal transduction histidine kinase